MNKSKMIIAGAWMHWWTRCIWRTVVFQTMGWSGY